MSFDRPEFLWLALLAPASLALAVFRTPRLERSLAALVGPARAASALAVHRFASIAGAACSVLFLLSAAMALAGPAWGSRAVAAERSGLEVAVVLDVSRSMLVPQQAGTASPTRLVAARETLRSLLRLVPDASFSLVAAKGGAVLLVPMTDDLEAIDSGLDYADPETLSTAGTDLEGGIMKGLASFTTRSGASRVLLLLSDGGEHGSDARRAATEARRKGVRILALGFGSAEALPVPGPSGSPLLDAKGLPVRSALDAAALKSFASISGGRYLDGSDSSARASLRAEFAELGKGGKRVEYEVQDQTALFTLLALVFLVGRFLAGAFALAGCHDGAKASRGGRAA